MFLTSVVFSFKVFMRLPNVCFALLLATGLVATASPLLHDPQILIDTGGDPLSIHDINVVQPNGNQTVTYDFVNDTSSIVTKFTFETTINKNLSGLAASSFTCADPGGYFLSCNTSYNSLTGDLRYIFSGVNPPDDDEDFDPENGEQEGIPPNGLFHITLQGWTPDATSAGEVLYNDIPSLTNTVETTAPEPAAALTLGTGLLLLAAIWRRRTAR
jgi:hypothetical protein